jgi:hypothetical protein
LSNVIDDLLVNAQELARAIALREHVLRKLNQLVLDLSQNGALVEVSAEAELRITLQVLLPVNGVSITPVVAPAAGYDPLRPAAGVVPPPAPETATAGKVTGPFTVAEKAFMDKRAGDGAAEIARALCRSVQSVALYLNGQKYSKDKVRAQGQPDAAAPGAVGQRPWTAADDDWLVEAVAQNRVSRAKPYGAMMEAAAAHLGRSAGTISNRTSSVLKDRILTREREIRRSARPADAPPRAPTAAEAVAAPQPVRAVVEAVVPPAPPFDPVVPVWRREIEDRLNRLGNAAPFTPQVDLALLEGLAKGHKLGWISSDLGIDFEPLKARFVRLVPEPGIVAQDRVLTVLRARAKAD